MQISLRQTGVRIDSQTVMHGGAVFEVGVSVTERGPSQPPCAKPGNEV